MINLKNKPLIIDLIKMDNFINSLKDKRPIPKDHIPYLKEVLKISEICRKCGEIHNISYDIKTEVTQSFKYNKIFILLLLINFYLLTQTLGGGLLFLFGMSVSFLLINSHKVSYCINCSSIDSFVKIKKYLK